MPRQAVDPHIGAMVHQAMQQGTRAASSSQQADACTHTHRLRYVVQVNSSTHRGQAAVAAVHAKPAEQADATVQQATASSGIAQ